MQAHARRHTFVVWAVFLGFIGACFISGTARAQALDDIDHYKCYQAKESKKVCQLDLGIKCKTDESCPGGICLQKFPKGVSVVLTDQFEDVTVEVKKPKNICPPVEKVPQGPPIQDPNLHYTEYQIKGGGKLEQRVLATDQFGDHVIELGGPKFLLVPTHKDHDGPVAAPIDGEDDHYLCRQAKHKKKICTGDLTTKCKSDEACAAVGGTCDLGFESRQQTLVNQFGQENVEVKKIKFFCTPAQKDQEPPPDFNGTHLVGYQIKGPDLAVGVHTNDQFGPKVLTTKKPKTLYVPALKTLAGGSPPIFIGEHKCAFDPSGSTIQIATQILNLPPFPASGGIDISCGTTGSDGKAPCDCTLQSLEPINLTGIGYICFTPGGACPAGEIDCDGGNALDVDMDSDHNIGACTGNPDCAAQCAAHCGSAEVFNSGCEGYCVGGARDELPCADDSECPGGSCPGKNGLPHGNICGCECLTVGGAPGVPGALQCNMPANIDVEVGAPCDGTDILIAVGTRCVPLTTQAIASQLHNTNDTQGKDFPDPAFTGNGIAIDCNTLATSTVTGLKLIGSVNFFDSTIGDLTTNETLVCQ